MVYLVVVEDAAAHHLAVVDKELGIALKVVLLHEGHCRPYAGHDEEDDEDGADAACLLLLELVGKVYLAELEVLDADVGGQHDEDAVDDKQVGGTDEIGKVAAGQAEACRAERRHEGGSDGHTGKHGTLLLAALLEDACKAAEEGDGHVVDGGVGAGKQFARVAQVERSEQEVEQRGHKAYRYHHKQVLHRCLHQLHVVGAQAESHTEDGAHQGRYEHGADDDGDGVHIESDGGDDHGNHENPGVRPAEIDVAADGLLGQGGIDVVVQVQSRLHRCNDISDQ